MIFGPIQPRTKDALWAQIRRNPDSLERGLRVVAEGLELPAEGLGAVDGLARDAADAPVLLIAAAGDRDPTLVPRLLEAHSFMERNSDGLGHAVPDLGVRFGEPFRILVVGIDLPMALVERIDGLGLEPLEILEVETFRLAGQARLVVRRPNRPGAAPPLADGSEGEALGRRCAALLELLSRLDPTLEVDGDRFSRRIAFRGRVILELWLERGQVLARVPDRDPVAMLAPDDDLQIADLAMRRYLDVLRELEPSRSVPADGAIQCERSSESQQGGVGGEAPAGRHQALDALRRSVAEARLSREEFSALGGTTTEASPPNG